MSTEQRSPVIAATDLTPGGEEAVRQASELAKRLERPLVVIHATIDALSLASIIPHADIDAASKVEDLKHRVQEGLYKTTASLTKRAEGDFRVVVRPGSAPHVILDLAEELSAHTVVVGATQAGKVLEWLLGSTAEQVVRHATCDVLVARSSPAGRNVVAALDLSPQSLTTLAAAAEQADTLGGSLIAAHCLEVPSPALATLDPAFIVDEDTQRAMSEASQKILEQELGALALSADRKAAVVLRARPQTAIIELLEKRQAQLLVISTHGRTGLLRVALGSVASQLIRKAPCSVLVCRPREAAAS